MPSPIPNDLVNLLIFYWIALSIWKLLLTSQNKSQINGNHC